jgi:hypothetical protein
MDDGGRGEDLMGTLGKRVDRLEREVAEREPAEGRITAVERRIIAPNGDVVEIIRRELR